MMCMCIMMPGFWLREVTKEIREVILFCLCFCFGAMSSSAQALILALTELMDHFWRAQGTMYYAGGQTPVGHMQGKYSTYCTVALAEDHL